VLAYLRKKINKIMANLALIRGAAMAAPKFTDIRAAVEPGIRRLEQIAAIRQREEEKRELNDKREEALDAQAYNQLPALMTDGIPEAWQGYYTEQAMLLKDESYALAQNRRNMKPIEFIDAQRKLSTKIGKMQEAVNWIKTYAAEEKADADAGLERSDSYTEDERELHFKILNMDPSIVPTMMDDQPAIQYTTDEGEIITKKLGDIERPRRKEYIKDNEIQKDIVSFLNQLASKGKFPGDPQFNDLLDAKLDSIELNKHEARSLAVDVFGIGGKRGQDAALIPALQPDIMKQFDANQDGEIDKDEYLTFINSIQSVDELKNIVKEQYKQVAISKGNEYKKTWEAEQEKIKQAQAAKGRGSMTKWEYDIMKANQEKQNLAQVLNPLKEMLGKGLLTEDKINMLINNQVPGLQVYQNKEQDENGNLIAPHMFGVEVNGKSIPFNINEEGGETLFKNILDLYGYTVGERYDLFNMYKAQDQKTTASTETPTNEIVDAGVKGPSLFGPDDFPDEEFEKLSTENRTLVEAFGYNRTGRDKKIITEIQKNYFDENGIPDFSERNVAKVKFDLFGREERNKEKQEEFFKQTEQSQSLEQLEKNFNEVPDTRVSRDKLNKISSKEKIAIRNFIQKPVGEITEKELAAYEYGKAGGDATALLATYKNKVNKLNNLNI